MDVYCVCCYGSFDDSNCFRYKIDGLTVYSCRDEACEEEIQLFTKDDVEKQVYLTGASGAQRREWEWSK